MLLRCGYKANMYPAATPLHAPRRRARAREEESEKGCLASTAAQRDTPIRSRVTRTTVGPNATIPQTSYDNETETFVFLRTFVGVTAPYA